MWGQFKTIFKYSEYSVRVTLGNRGSFFRPVDRNTLLRFGGHQHESGEATRKPLVQSGSFTVLIGLQSIFWITLLKQKACKKCYLQIEKFEATVKDVTNLN